MTLGFDVPRQISAISIANGVQRADKLGDLFALNNRARDIRLTGIRSIVEIGCKVAAAAACVTPRGATA